METSEFVDYYEILEISPNANSDSIERMFRYLAMRYHPDNQATSDRGRFDLILEAHNTLRDPARRVEYDISRARHLGVRTQLVQEAGDKDSVEHDVDIQNQVLSILYVKRRRNIRDPGVGEIELEQVLECPIDHMEFHIWYLKEKKLILRGEDGKYAITAAGVDRICEDHQDIRKKLITDQS
jgi:curved DNA-binding protein CbpA